MSNLYGTYFEALPKELLEFIVETITYDGKDSSVYTLDNLGMVSYTLYKLINDRNVWNRIMSRLIYYPVIQDEIKDKHSKPLELRDVIISMNYYSIENVEPDELAFDDTFLDMIDDIIYRNNIKREHPQFYKHVKDYNLYYLGLLVLR